MENDRILLKEIEDNLMFMISHADHRLVLKKLTTILMETKALKNLLTGDDLRREHEDDRPALE